MVDPTKITRWRSTATTWVRKTCALLLNADPRNRDEQWLIGYDAARFMTDVLGELEMLAPLLGPHADDVQVAAVNLYGTVKRARLAEKLEHVEGRTPEEAASFLDKAARLRQDTSL